MVTRKPASGKSAAAAKCPTCKGSGETSVRVVVGSRRKHTTDDHQSGLCLTCMGSGEAMN
ncbi:hypothetical protein [Streptomyces boncukensis]|uniref:Molecular chaperone DnaJ n=1 Tax=Streptomyces boncukensis TaxID=2711219 RepID=A0A6G4X4U3_9ACTN|nr:hypothetical protein [Streptomyces boncukensis]NGO72556.1 hypothetical protein [Streptomyces boncukensis]